MKIAKKKSPGLAYGLMCVRNQGVSGGIRGYQGEIPPGNQGVPPDATQPTLEDSSSAIKWGRQWCGRACDGACVRACLLA